MGEGPELGLEQEPGKVLAGPRRVPLHKKLTGKPKALVFSTHSRKLVLPSKALKHLTVLPLCSIDVPKDWSREQPVAAKSLVQQLEAVQVQLELILHNWTFELHILQQLVRLVAFPRTTIQLTAAPPRKEAGCCTL